MTKLESYVTKKQIGMVIIKNRHRYITPQVSFEEEESVTGLLAGSITGEAGGPQGSGDDSEFAKQSNFIFEEDFEYQIPE